MLKQVKHMNCNEENKASFSARGDLKSNNIRNTRQLNKNRHIDEKTMQIGSLDY